MSVQGNKRTAGCSGIQAAPPENAATAAGASGSPVLTQVNSGPRRWRKLFRKRSIEQGIAGKTKSEVSAEMTVCAFRRSGLGLVLAVAALIGLLLSPFCDAYLPHAHDGSMAVDVPTLYVSAAPSRALPGVDVPRSGGDETCCSVVAERPKAVTAESYLLSGASPDAVLAASSYRQGGDDAPLRAWHRRLPGASPVSALHARSAPLLI